MKTAIVKRPGSISWNLQDYPDPPPVMQGEQTEGTLNFSAALKHSELYAQVVEKQNAYNLFYRGDYANLVAQTIDTPVPAKDSSQIPPVIGALTFLGRLEEAELLYHKFENKFTALEKMMSRFFLGVVNCRHFNFDKARTFFGSNANEFRSQLKKKATDKETNLKMRFFAYQGFGFYRYTYGHLRPALKSAEIAYAAAFEADFLWGRLFSQDLKAHAQINLGKTHIGLKAFGQSMAFAQTLGRGALLQMFRVTISIYRARFGISGNEAVEEILSTLSETTFEDGYSRACLLAELSHQYLLRGKADKAKEALDSACESVYRIDNPRLEILLNFRIAVLLFYRGESGQALHLIRSSAKRLSSHVDRLLEIRIRGLERDILEKTGNMADAAKLGSWLETQTRRCGFVTSKRILDRKRNIFQSDKLKGQDPLGDFIDEVTRRRELSAIEIVEKGWLGLLYLAFKIDPSERTVLIGIAGKSLTLFDQGNVSHLSRGASNQVAKFLLLLATGEKSKEEIITVVWQQSYHPLRHDPLLYSLVSKLRRELGTKSNWVEATENGYRLQTGTIVREASVKEPPTTKADYLDPIATGSNFESQKTFQLNYRQQQILVFLKKHGSIDVGSCGKNFQISVATANRDLVFLESSGLVLRSGRGRATRYHLNIEILGESDVQIRT